MASTFLSVSPLLRPHPPTTTVAGARRSIDLAVFLIRLRRVFTDFHGHFPSGTIKIISLLLLETHREREGREDAPDPAKCVTVTAGG